MDSNVIMKTIVSLLITVAFFIIPLIYIISNTVMLIRKKKCVDLAGNIIHKNDSDKKDRMGGFIVLYLAIFAFGIFQIYVNNLSFGIALIIQGISMTLTNQFEKAYSRVNGIYENGIINEGFIGWEKVFSWKLLSENTFSFLLKTGSRIDYKFIYRKDILIEILNKNNVNNEDKIQT